MCWLGEVKNSCTPIKITKTSDSSGDVVVNSRWSKVLILKSLPFQYNASIPSDQFVNIVNLSQLANLEFVRVRAQVVTVEDPSNWSNRDGSRVEKQQIVLRDNIGSLCYTEDMLANWKKVRAMNCSISDSPKNSWKPFLFKHFISRKFHFFRS